MIRKAFRMSVNPGTRNTSAGTTRSGRSWRTRSSSTACAAIRSSSTRRRATSSATPRSRARSAGGHRRDAGLPAVVAAHEGAHAGEPRRQPGLARPARGVPHRAACRDEPRSGCAASRKSFGGVRALRGVSFDLRAGRGARARRRERRGQEHARQDLTGAHRPGRGHGRDRRAPARARRPAAARGAGRRAHLSAAGAVSRPDRGREPRLRPRARGAVAARRLAARRRRARRSCWPGSAPASIADAPARDAAHGRAAARRDRARAGRGGARPAHGRADGLAHRAGRRERLFDADPRAARHGRRRSSTSRTAWRRCCASPTASPCCATAQLVATRPMAERRPGAS